MFSGQGGAPRLRPWCWSRVRALLFVLPRPADPLFPWCSATGFTTRSDIGPASIPDGVPAGSAAAAGGEKGKDGDNEEKTGSDNEVCAAAFFAVCVC